LARQITYFDGSFAFPGLDVDLSMEADMSITRWLALPSILAVLACAAGPAVAGDAPKEARGIVTSLRGGSLAINLPSDTDVTFRLDDKTSSWRGAPGERCVGLRPTARRGSS
jgi:hypothetical protein